MALHWAQEQRGRTPLGRRSVGVLVGMRRPSAERIVACQVLGCSVLVGVKLMSLTIGWSSFGCCVPIRTTQVGVEIGVYWE